MKKRLLSLVMAMSLCLSLAVPAYAVSYDDVNGHWAENSINRWSEYQIVEGSGGHFRPDASLTRAEMAKILAGTLGLSQAPASLPFADVPADAWYAPYVGLCYQAGIMRGDGTNANPNASITRQEAMVMLCRALGIAEKQSPDLSAFGDQANVADWAKGSVAAMTEAGIVNGVGENQLAPKADINRASIMAILDRAVVQYINAPGTYPLSAQDGIVVVAAGDVTLTGSTPADILITPAAAGKTLTFQDASVTGAITVQADNAKVVKSGNTNLPELNTTGSGVTVEDGKQSATPAKPSGGGGGGGQNASVSVLVNGTSSSAPLSVGDKLTASTSGASGLTLVWSVGGFDQTGSEYTVTAKDLGKEIFAKLMRADGTEAAVSAKLTVASSAEVNVKSESSPVQITSQDTKLYMLGDDGTPTQTPIEMKETDKLEVTIRPKTVAQNAPEAADTKSKVADKIQDSVLETIKSVSGNSHELSDSEKTALAAATEVKAVDVDMTLVQTTTDENGETDTTRTNVHPVGTTKVVLSATQLGLAGEDLRLYHLVAKHTNVNGNEQTIPGVVDEKGETVTFETNGLSTIWIGNVPPRTVTFDTGAGGTQVPSQKVKFGNRVNTSKLPEKIERSGYLFCGWNYDPAVTIVIENMTFTSVWVSGRQIPAERITATLSDTDSNIALTKEDGKVTATANKDAEAFTQNLKVNLTIANLNGAAKYGISQNAQTAAAMAAENMTPVSGSSVTLDPVTVTSANGNVNAGRTSSYIKWVDAKDNVLALEEIVVVVDNGMGAAESKTVTRSVNRGLGRFEPYLTSSTKETAPKWVGYINGYLKEDNDEYRLAPYVGFGGNSFDDSYFPKDYDTLTLEFAAFSGESFANKTISAEFAYDNGSETVKVPCTPAEKSDSSLKFVLDTKTLNVPEAQEYFTLDLNITTDGVGSTITFYIPNPRSDQVDGNDVSSCFSNMTELKDALSKVTEGKANHIVYNGTETQFIINESIDIPANCVLVFRNTAVTIADGASLTLHSETGSYMSGIQFSETGTLTVAQGGKVICTEPGYVQGSFHSAAFIHCNTIIVNGTIETQDNGFLSLTCYADRAGSCTLSPGSKIEIDSASLHIANFDTLRFGAQANISGNGGLNLQCEEIQINGTINDNASDTSRTGLEIYGGTTIEPGGQVKVNGGYNDIYYCAYINGNLNNKGTITIASGQDMSLNNTGFAIQNSGTIQVNGTLALGGTKLINTGTIAGSGTINGRLGEDTTSYDEKNGLEYETVSGSQTPSNYSRYKFTSDPDKTVEVTLYKASLVNEQGGTCSITPDFEEFPQN